MINNKKIIEKAISEINSLTFEEIENVIQKVEQEEMLNSEKIEVETRYIENKKYYFDLPVFDYKTVHRKENILKKILRGKDKNDMAEVA